MKKNCSWFRCQKHSNDIIHTYMEINRECFWMWMRVEMVKSTELLKFFRIRKVNIWHNLNPVSVVCWISIFSLVHRVTILCLFVYEIFAWSKEGSRALNCVANGIVQVTCRPELSKAFAWAGLIEGFLCLRLRFDYLFAHLSVTISQQVLYEKRKLVYVK